VDVAVDEARHEEVALAEPNHGHARRLQRRRGVGGAGAVDRLDLAAARDDDKRWLVETSHHVELRSVDDVAEDGVRGAGGWGERHLCG